MYLAISHQPPSQQKLELHLRSGGVGWWRPPALLPRHPGRWGTPLLPCPIVATTAGVGCRERGGIHQHRARGCRHQRRLCVAQQRAHHAGLRVRWGGGTGVLLTSVCQWPNSGLTMLGCGLGGMAATQPPTGKACAGGSLPAAPSSLPCPALPCSPHPRLLCALAGPRTAMVQLPGVTDRGAGGECQPHDLR